MSKLHSSAIVARRCPPGGARRAGAAIAALILLATSVAAADWSKVSLKVVWDLDRASWSAMEGRVTSAVIANLSARSSNFEVLAANPELPAPGAPNGEVPTRWTAVAYDYAAEQAWLFTLDNQGNILAREPYQQERFADQPVPSEQEFANAVAMIQNDPVLGPLVVAGKLVPYEAMPPVVYERGVPRSLNVGLQAVENPDDHEVVSVAMGSGRVTRYESGAPEDARADRGSCGPASGAGCPNNNTGSGMATISWPADNPVWTFDVIRPVRTQTSATSNGAGVELRNVRYEGKLVLLSANVPVLNVFYTGNACGPFRDWLFSESCFDVTGGTESPAGFYTSTAESATICVDGTDAGNFRGVGIQTTEDALILVSEMSAGWYRYLNGWKLYANGDIKADFFYAGTFNSCTCNERIHHAYWRLDWAIDGVEDVSGPGGYVSANKPQRRDTPTVDSPWSDIALEETSLRATTYPAATPQYRVMNEETGVGYLVIPSKPDNTAAADANGVSDMWFLKWKANETDDTGFGSAINLSTYHSSAEAIGEERFVMWYGGHLYQSGGESGGANTCAQFGPYFRRVVAPVGPVAGIGSVVSGATNAASIPVTITFDRAVVGFEESDLTLVNATSSNFAGSDAVYTVDLAPVGQGAVSLSLLADVAQDADGNGNVASSPFSVTYDSVRPAPGLQSAIPSLTNLASIPVTINFGEAVAGFAAADLQLTNATSSNFAGGPSSYTVNIVPSGQGAVSVGLGADVCADLAGNGNDDGGELNFTFDSIRPATTLSSAAPAATNLASIPVTIEFDEAVAGFDASDLGLTNATASGFAGGPTVFTANLAPIAQGNVTLSISAGAGSDAAGNSNTAAANLTRFFDSIAPTIAFDSSAPATTNKSPIPLTITFNESVTGFEASDLVLVNATAQNLAGGPTVFTVELVPSAKGEVTASVEVGACVDVATNGNVASGVFSRIYSPAPPQPSGVIVGNDLR